MLAFIWGAQSARVAACVVEGDGSSDDKQPTTNISDGAASSESPSTARSAASQQQQRRGGNGGLRSWRSTDSLADLCRPISPAEWLDRLAHEAVNVLGLAVRLWSYLGLGWKWLFNFYRLVAYAALLMPGFARLILYYFLSPSVTRSVPYGRKPRQRLDLYLPPRPPPPGSAGHPVVVFVTGGAWTIGYKAWGALLARRLSAAGVLVACLDYRNFPQGSALDMLEDVNTGIAWVSRRAAHYGGDADALHLVGQSAGGQLALLCLLAQAAQAAAGEAVLGAAPVWHPADVRSFVGVSGAYDLEGLAAHLHARGLYRELLDTVMSIDGAVAYDALSPLAAARAAAVAVADNGGGGAGGKRGGSGSGSHGVARFMPDVLLVHGTRDKSVPPAGSVAMASALRAAGVRARAALLDGKTHTDLLLEDALAGGRDALVEAVLSVVLDGGVFGDGGGGAGVSAVGGAGVDTVGDSAHGGALDARLRLSYPRLCPRVLVRLASMVCPF